MSLRTLAATLLLAAVPGASFPVSAPPAIFSAPTFPDLGKLAADYTAAQKRRPLKEALLAAADAKVTLALALAMNRDPEPETCP